MSRHAWAVWIVHAGVTFMTLWLDMWCHCFARVQRQAKLGETTELSGNARKQEILVRAVIETQLLSIWWQHISIQYKLYPRSQHIRCFLKKKEKKEYTLFTKLHRSTLHFRNRAAWTEVRSYLKRTSKYWFDNPNKTIVLWEVEVRRDEESIKCSMIPRRCFDNVILGGRQGFEVWRA